ncbi:hypothetical protein CPB86DRAFT_854396 [Serendipita vermifera]|nr:hypothetical protein CPB86DRAFT_854396 [Serendipita vermifera]
MGRSKNPVTAAPKPVGGSARAPKAPAKAPKELAYNLGHKLQSETSQGAKRMTRSSAKAMSGGPIEHPDETTDTMPEPNTLGTIEDNIDTHERQVVEEMLNISTMHSVPGATAIGKKKGSDKKQVVRFLDDSGVNCNKNSQVHPKRHPFQGSSNNSDSTNEDTFDYVQANNLSADEAEDDLDIIIPISGNSRSVSKRGKAPKNLSSKSIGQLRGKGVVPAGSNGVVRTIKVDLDCTFDAFISKVSARLGIEDEPISLSYYFAWGRQSKQSTLESSDEWDDLVQVALKNHHRKLSGPHMVFINDASAHQRGGKESGKKGKGGAEKVVLQNCVDTGQLIIPNQEAKSEPDNVTYYAKILAKHKCLSCNQICYITGEGDDENIQEHDTNDKHKKTGDFGINDLPSELVKEVLPETKPSTNQVNGLGPYNKAAPKRRGMNGNISMAPAHANNPGQSINPFGPPPPSLLPSSNAGWPPQQLVPMTQPQFFIMPPEMLSPLKRTMGVTHPVPPASPTRSHFLVDEGPELREWIPLLDTHLQEREQLGPYLHALEDMLLTRVRDLVRYPAKDIAEWTGCPLPIIGRACEYAHQTMGVPYRK